MTSQQPPKQCKQCGSFYLPHEEEEHINMHIDPSKLAPKTSPNDMRKIELAKVIITEERTDESDIALRSLLPDEIPKPQEERKKMRAPDVENEPQNASIYNPYGAGGNEAHNYNRVRDRLDLNSKLASTDLHKDNLNKLEIEKQVQIKPIKTVVPKKEIHKFQNSHYAGKETRDLGGCGKKEMPNGLNGANGGDDRVSGPFIGSGVLIGSGGQGGQGVYGEQGGQGYGRVLGEGNDMGYEVKADNSYHANTSKKASVVVHINRKTGNPNEFKPVDTKANQLGDSSKRISNAYPNQREQSESERNGYGKGSMVKPYPVNGHSGQGFGGHSGHAGHAANGYHFHPHECPGCHGFYCQHCHSTIPPEYRPFWDSDENPDMVEYYKKRVRECRDKERQKERKMREGCGQCNNHKKEEKIPN